MSALLSSLDRLRERGWGRGTVASAHSRGTKRFRAPVGARVTSPLLVQRRSNQEETTPRLALAGHPARQVREAGPGFSSGLLPARKGESILGLARCAAWSSPPHCRPGAPKEQACLVHARSQSAANVRHSVLLWLLLLRAGARCSTRAPYGAAGGWRKVRRMAHRDAGQFSVGTRRCRRKTPPSGRAPGRQSLSRTRSGNAWRARHRGAVSLWLLSLWASKEKVARLPAGRRNRLESCECAKAKTSLTPILLLGNEAAEGMGAHQTAPPGMEGRTSHPYAQDVAQASIGAQP